MDKSDFQNRIRIFHRGATNGQFVLAQNYPNPFTNTTNISFSLIESSLVWLDIYNSMGKKIAQLLNTQMNAGEHIVEWSRLWHGSVLSAGNYAYQLNVENSKGLHKHIKVMTVF
jgi:hypothetical protein